MRERALSTSARNLFNMIIFVLVVFIICILSYIIQNKIFIRLDTFFRKGFSKHDDKYGVYCFCGKQGDGKTYSLVDMLSDTGKHKIKICNIKSLCELSNNYCYGIDNIPMFLKNHEDFFVYETDFNKIQDYIESVDDTSKYIIVFDEIFTLIEKGKLSRDCLSFLSQMRKRGLYLYTTCQEWLELNVTFRRYVRYQIVCKMINIKILNFAICVNKINNAYEMKWDNLENEYICPIIRTNIKKCSKQIADSYDTFEVIKTTGKLVK